MRDPGLVCTGVRTWSEHQMLQWHAHSRLSQRGRPTLQRDNHGFPASVRVNSIKPGHRKSGSIFIVESILCPRNDGKCNSIAMRWHTQQQIWHLLLFVCFFVVFFFEGGILICIMLNISCNNFNLRINLSQMISSQAYFPSNPPDFYEMSRMITRCCVLAISTKQNAACHIVQRPGYRGYIPAVWSLVVGGPSRGSELARFEGSAWAFPFSISSSTIFFSSPSFLILPFTLNLSVLESYTIPLGVLEEAGAGSALFNASPNLSVGKWNNDCASNTMGYNGEPGTWMEFFPLNIKHLSKCKHYNTTGTFPKSHFLILYKT